ncbi:hypothetical protein XENTR_v10005958 [Xenopus tropicalis]|nr:hypothetical protein XENTR_v10005958 [Xenopus tropicalis]
MLHTLLGMIISNRIYCILMKYIICISAGFGKRILIALFFFFQLCQGKQKNVNIPTCSLNATFYVLIIEHILVHFEHEVIKFSWIQIADSN